VKLEPDSAKCLAYYKKLVSKDPYYAVILNEGYDKCERAKTRKFFKSHVKQGIYVLCEMMCGNARNSEPTKDNMAKGLHG
jgi:hypothetical protein